MEVSREEKLALMKSLNWDYAVSPGDMLDVVEGKTAKAGPFDETALFIRSLERLHWQYVVALWGVEGIKRLYTPEAAARIWPKSRRRNFDFAVGILRKEPVPPAEWGTPYCRALQHTFLPDRWNRA
jgi:hypothetical protein